MVDIKKEDKNAAEKTSIVTIENPEDEIELTEISDKPKETSENNIYIVKGEFKNPNYKSFSIVKPEEEIKTL